MRFAVYLSSTLKDLEEERRAVQEALGDQCIVRHSYRASEQALVASCLDDVAQARSPRSAKRTAWSGLCSRAYIAPVEARLEPLLHRLGKESLYVPGAPGSGKSTFCRWLALSGADDEVRAHPMGVPKEFEESMPKAVGERCSMGGG